MYYELGTMVSVWKDASPFINHEKGISIPSMGIIGEIMTIHPSILSYTVRLSKKIVLTFSEDDLYTLPDRISSRRDMFHKMLGSITADAHPFYYVKEFEEFVSRAEKQSTMLNDSKYKLGDIVLYHNNCYRIKGIIEEPGCGYKYDLFLDREPRLGELSTIKGVDERAINCPKAYFPDYKFDQKFTERHFDSSLKALDEFNRREFERIAASPIRIDIDDEIKAHYSKEEIKKMIDKAFGAPKPTILYKKIIFSGPCTIIIWADGTKTIAKASGGDVFDPEKGVAICFMKKALGHTEANKVLRKANKQYEDYIAENGINISIDEFIDFCKNALKSDTKPADHIDQSTINEVKKVGEQDEKSNR